MPLKERLDKRDDSFKATCGLPRDGLSRDNQSLLGLTRLMTNLVFAAVPLTIEDTREAILARKHFLKNSMYSGIFSLDFVFGMDRLKLLLRERHLPPHSLKGI